MTTRWHRRALIWGTAVLAVLHAAGGLTRTGPAVMADEAGYLFDIRVLTGTGSGPLAGTSFYRGGWSLLLAPVQLLTDSPTAVFTAGLLLNALLAAAVVPLVHVVLRRHLQVQPAIAVPASLAAGAYPALHVLSQAALPEALLAVLVLLAAVCFGELVLARRHRELGWAAALGLTLSFSSAVHGRALVLLAVGLIAVLLLAARRDIAVASAAVVLLVAVAGLAAVMLLDGHLRSVAYAGQAANDVSPWLHRLATRAGAGGFVRNVVGQSWYVAVASLGLLPLLAVRWRDPDARSLVRGPGVGLLATAVTAGGLLVLSSATLAVAHRPDHLVYGRYVEAALPLLIGVAVAELLRRRPTRAQARAAVGAVLLLTALTCVARWRLDPGLGPNRWNIASLPAAPTGELGVRVLLVAAGCALAVMLAARLPRIPLAGAVLAAFAAVAAYGQLVPVASAEREVYGAGWTDPGDIVGRRSVAVVPETTDPFARYAYPWFTRGAVPLGDDAGFLFADFGWQRAGWRRVWADPHHRAGLFTRLPRP